MQSCSYNNAGRFYLLCQHNSQILMLVYYAQNYASIICKALLLSSTQDLKDDKCFMILLDISSYYWQIISGCNKATEPPPF